MQSGSKNCSGGPQSAFCHGVGRVAEWFKAAVLKFAFACIALVYSVPSGVELSDEFDFSIPLIPLDDGWCRGVGDHFGDHSQDWAGDLNRRSSDKPGAPSASLD